MKDDHAGDATYTKVINSPMQELKSKEKRKREIDLDLLLDEMHKNQFK